MFIDQIIIKSDIFHTRYARQPPYSVHSIAIILATKLFVVLGLGPPAVQCEKLDINIVQISKISMPRDQQSVESLHLLILATSEALLDVDILAAV